MRTKIVVLVFFSLFLAGCQSPFSETRFVRQRYPILKTPDRPQLKNIAGEEMRKMSPQAQKDVADNFNALIDYSRKYEATVNVYNSFAVEQNEASKMYVGIRDKELYGEDKTEKDSNK